MPMKKLIFLTILFAIPALANTPSKTGGLAKKECPPIQVDYFDTFKNNFLQPHRSKSVKKLKVALNALQNNKFSQAINLAKPVLNDIGFSDYADWIISLGYRQQAETLCNKLPSPKAIPYLQKSIHFMKSIESTHAYSPLIRQIPKEIAANELILASILTTQKQWTKATETYEVAFQRLLSQNALLTIAAKHIDLYAQSCKKHMSPYCLSWFQKFSSTYSKNSIETKGMLKSFPNLFEQIRYDRPSFTRSNQIYKNQDLDQLAFEAALKAYQSDEKSKAEDGFLALLKDYPKSSYRIRAKYLLTQLLNPRKKQEQIQAFKNDIIRESPWSFYGVLTLQANQSPLQTRLDHSPPEVKNTDPSLLPIEIYQLHRAESLLAENVPELAALELKDFRFRDSMSSPFITYLAMLQHLANNDVLSFQMLGELIQRQYEGLDSKPIHAMILPIRYYPEIQFHSDKYELDPILILSLIKQESAFFSHAISSVGALGLMQLMPATAVDVDPNIQLSQLMTPALNIQTGVKYLKTLQRHYQGNLICALAGYNAGPSTVDRWLKDFQKSKTLEPKNAASFIEFIPYRETRDYVSAIVRNYLWYNETLNPKKQVTLESFWK